MNWNVIVFFIIVVVIAYLIALYSKSRGYPFWRTFFLAIIGITGVGLIFIKIFGRLIF